jgi:hypothetical protein
MNVKTTGSERNESMDSYDVHKEFAVAWISREDIKSHLELTDDQIASLTDHDMRQIADMMYDVYLEQGYWDDLELCTKRLLADKEAHHGYA